MCGVLAVISKEKAGFSESGFNGALDLMQPRGPDDRGVVFRRHAALGARRLKIIDTSDAGHQPMTAENGLVTLVFNGMIYNYQELRDDLRLKGHVFTSSCDTEVVLRAYLEYGEQFIYHLQGMWGLIIWDERIQAAFISRDRFGVKPLYFFQAEDKFIIASEIKSILHIAGRSAIISKERVFRYLARGWADDSGQSFFDNIHPVSPGTIRKITLELTVSSRRYWDLVPGSQIEPSIEQFRQKLIDTVVHHARADAPMAVTLSSGIDSSGVASILGERGLSHNITAYTVVPPGTEDETPQSLIDFYGINHKKIVLENINMADEFAAAIAANDEPINGSNSVYQMILRRHMQADGIKVLLTGEGADELLAGYERTLPFFLTSLLQNARLDQLSQAVNGACNFLGTTNKGVIDFWMPFLKAKLNNRYMQMHEVSVGVISPEIFSRYSDSILEQGYLDRQDFSDGKVLFENLYTHLFDRFIPLILRIEDRISSAYGIEARVPYLDHQLAEMAWAFPFWRFMDGGRNKAILRQALKGIVPNQVLEINHKLRKPGNNAVVAYDLLYDNIRSSLENAHEYAREFYVKNVVEVFDEDVKSRDQNRAFFWLRAFMLDIWLRNLDVMMKSR